MEIKDTPLYRLALPVLNGGPTSTNYTWKMLIHYTDSLTVSPVQIETVNWYRDYVQNYADEVTVTLQIPLGVFAKLIYPNRDKLQVTLTKILTDEVGNIGGVSSGVESERYSAILIDADKAATIMQGTEAMDQESLDLRQILTIGFQLYDTALEQLRTILIGGIYRTCTVKDALLTAMSNESQAAVVDDDRAVIGVDLIEPNNVDLKGQIVITHGTKLIDFPDYLQARVGIYNSGLGHYIQNKYWYCYSLYDATQFNKRPSTVTFIILPERKFSNVERTFMAVGNNLIVLITGETAFQDDAGRFRVNQGNGLRFADANNLLDSISNKDNTSSISRKENNSEFTTMPAVNGVDHAPLLADRITANPFVAYSMLAARNGGMVKMLWQNSDHTLLTPGMKAKVVYDLDGTTVSVYGVVHKAIHNSTKAGGYGTARFKQQTVLSVFVNNQVSTIES